MTLEASLREALEAAVDCGIKHSHIKLDNALWVENHAMVID